MEESITKEHCKGVANSKTVGSYLCSNTEFIIDSITPEFSGVEILSTDDSYCIEDQLIIDKIHIPKKSYTFAVQIGTFYKKLSYFEQLCYKKAWDLRHDTIKLDKPFLFNELYKKLNLDITCQFYNIEAHKKFSGDFLSWNNINDITIEQYYKFLYYHLYQLFGPDVKMPDTNWFPTFVNMFGNRLLWLMHIACPKLTKMFYECIDITPIYLINPANFCWIIVNHWIITGRIMKQIIRSNKILLYELFSGNTENVTKNFGINEQRLASCKILYINDSNFIIYLAK